MKTNSRYMHGKRLGLLIMAVAWIAAADNGWTDTNYVSLDGSDANNGSSWATAFKTISNAVALAGDAAVTNVVMVSNGTYVLTKNIDITKNITLRSLAGAEATVLNGNYPFTTNGCLKITASNVVVDGFTISNGLYQYGGGIWVTGTGTVQNCIIRNNSAGWSTGGGAVYEASGRIIISNCLVAYNVSSNAYGGGGIQMSHGLVEKCRIIGNRVIGSSDGGGLSLGKKVDVKNCLIQGNYVAVGKGGGIACDGTQTNDFPYFQNCTIAGNTCGSSGGGLYLVRWTGSVVNVIMFLNSGASTAFNIASVAGASYTNCCIGIASASLPAGVNVTNLYPRFVDPQNSDYRLAADSPYINWGMNQEWMPGARDVDGRTRIDRYSGIVDLGAYEFVPRGTLFSIH